MGWIKKIQYNDVHRCNLPRKPWLTGPDWEVGSIWECDGCKERYVWGLVGGYAGNFEWDLINETGGPRD